MKPEQVKVLKFGINYGLITGAISVLYTILLVSMNLLYDQSLTKALTGFALLIIPIVLTIVLFKKQNNNSLTVGQALTIGVITAFISALVTIVFTIILTNFLIPEFWDKSAELNRITILKQTPNITPEQLNDQIAMKRKLAWITYPFIIIFNLAIGFITSLLAGIKLKTTEKI